MIKIDLARAISWKMETTLKDAEEFVDVFTQVVTEALMKGEKVQLTGFGTWEVRKYSERIGRNPRTGEMLNVPGFNYPAFKAGKNLKDNIAGTKAPVTPVAPLTPDIPEISEKNVAKKEPAEKKNGGKAKGSKSASAPKKTV